jgi:GNAT superfamily N-acetyltransferase
MLGVRLATVADAPAVGRLLHAFNSEFDWPTPGAAVLAERLERLLGAGELIIVIGGQGPDGLAQLSFRHSVFDGAPIALLEELYVAPPMRGGGLGRALLEGAIEAARERDAVSIELNTSDDDTAAIALYESAGFTNREGRPDGPPMRYYEREI